HASLDADLTFGSEERYSSDPPRSPRNARNSAYVPCEASSGVRSSNAAIPQTSRTRGQPASDVHLGGRPSLRVRFASHRPSARKGPHVEAFAVPIKPGKEETWKSWAAEISGARKAEFDDMNERMGLSTHAAWLQQNA